MRIIPVILILFCCSCSQTQETNNTAIANSPDSILIQNNVSAIHDTLSQTKSQASEDILKPSNAEKIVKKKTVKESFSRFNEFPGNNNFNGEPLIQQLEIKLKRLDVSPDTLKQIAKERYISFERYFPVSIADNFEEGISTEHIYYPELIFKFQVFEDEFASKPYLEKVITVKKENNGEFNIE